MAIEVLLPALSPTMTEGTLAKWLKKEGESVIAGDVIAEVETDKATMEIEAIDDGTLQKILVEEGTEGIPINTPIGIIVEESPEPHAEIDSSGGDHDVALKGNTKVSRDEAINPEVKLEEQVNPVVAEDGEGVNKRILASPLAKRMASQEKLNLAEIAGSGPGGRIVKADILDLLSKRSPDSPSVSERIVTSVEEGKPVITEKPPFRASRNTNMRKVIARRLTESKATIPHFYITLGIEIDKLLEVRSELNKEDNSPSLSINDFFIRATALALKSLPSANATWTEQDTLYHERVDIAVAVAVEGGLITPVITDAANKGLGSISTEMKDLAKRAKAGKLLPEEYQGGTFSISNLGMFGVREFAAVINPPQAGILAIGAALERPVVKNSSIAIVTSIDCTLSCDHRVIDGAVGAKLLNIIKGLMENPLTMLL